MARLPVNGNGKTGSSDRSEKGRSHVQGTSTGRAKIEWIAGFEGDGEGRDEVTSPTLLIWIPGACQ